jgi:ATP-dependent Zn protease
MNNLRRTAFHEAGHVVMMLAQNVRFHHVTIEPGEDYLGVVVHRLSKRLSGVIETRDLLKATRAVEPLIRIDYAGGVAMGIHCGRRGRWRGAEGDFHNAGAWLLQIYGEDGPELQAHQRHLLLQTEAVLDSPGCRWQTETIAAALLERRTLTRDEVTAVLRDAAQ